MTYELRMRDDGILELFPSDTGKEMATLLKEFDSYLEAATEAEPLLLLVDSRRTDKLSAKSRKTFAQLARDPRLGKCATLGLGRRHRMIVSFVNRAIGRGNNRFFESKQEAIAWLKAEQ